MVGLWERRSSVVSHVLRRHEAAPRDRARPRCTRRACCSSTSRPSGSIRRRAAQSGSYIERAQGARGHHDLPDHPLHGRSGALRPHRDHRRRADRRRWTRRTRSRRASGTTACGSNRRRRCGDRRARRTLRSRGAVSRGQLCRSTCRDGEEFVPRLFAELGVPILSVNVARPDAGRRVHDLHGQDDPGRGGLGHRTARRLRVHAQAARR